MNDQKRVFLPLSTRNRTPRIAIMGYTPLGEAIESCFDKDQVEIFIADEKFNVDVDNVMDFAPDLVFVCYNIEIHEGSGRMDASKVEDAFLKILRRTKAAIAVCSDVTPEIMERMCNTIDDPEDILRFIHWPSFAREEAVAVDMKQPSYAVFGGHQDSVADLKHFLNFYSDMILPAGIVCNPIEASYIKCAVNGFLSLKNAYVNQLYDAMDTELEGKVTRHIIMKSFMSEPRIGATAARVNFPRGFKGEQKKLLETFLGYTSNFSLLETAKEINDGVQAVKQEIEDIDIDTTEEETDNVSNG